ncbi:hypothetical protein [Porphyromonas sp.]|uniref:hypothetical protein n=1 Tax=Porphyromonas sp. TaxID=1924944 RepID=UPI0026DD6C7F|nr:hypothetical protein [Porphyromonas sp.]MDO4695481.1 hypothetical protein [Porphyromonas sp.]MDO4770285.1 hypothetical protein [Porphyromonas sp.]
MRKDKLTLVPKGGLTDRLKVIASAISLALEAETRMDIIWFSDERLYCPSYRLFTLDPMLEEAGIFIREATAKDWFFNDLPQTGNGFLSYPFLFFRYDRCFSPKDIRSICENGQEQLLSLFRGREHILISSETSLGDHRNMFDLMKASVEVKNAFQSNISDWSDNVVGVHLDSCRKNDVCHHNPIELFIKRMQGMIEDDPSVSFFIASDMPEERERLSTVFAGRIFMPHTVSLLNTPKGCINAFGELLALSQTKHILSTKGGSFSQVAALIGNISLETLSIYSE